jgi:hypothetical protein
MMAMHLVKTHVPLCLIVKYRLPLEMTVGRAPRLLLPLATLSDEYLRQRLIEVSFT